MFLLLTERIRQIIQTYTFSIVVKVTSSFGICDVQTGDDIAHLIGRADQVLYEAKSAGRNCVKAA